MTSDLILIASLFSSIVTQIFLGLDTVKYEGISILDLFCAMWLFRLIIWFIWRIIRGQTTDPGYSDNDKRLKPVIK